MAFKKTNLNPFLDMKLYVNFHYKKLKKKPRNQKTNTRVTLAEVESRLWMGWKGAWLKSYSFGASLLFCCCLGSSPHLNTWDYLEHCF